MAKHVIETVQVIRRKYYVEVEDAEWGCDAIVFNEIDCFSYTHLSEDVTSITTVENDFPVATKDDTVNAEVAVYNYETEEWEATARWDLA